MPAHCFLYIYLIDIKNKLKKFTPLYYFLGAFILALLFKNSFFNQPTSKLDRIDNNDQVAFVEPIPEIISYNFDVKPILSDKCYKCHGPDPKAIEGDFRLDLSDHWYRISKENVEKQIITPGVISKSELIDRIHSERSSHKMPPPESNLILSDRDKQVLERWIEQGAKWETHWAYIPPVKQIPPKTTFEDWCKSPIDYFVAAKLEENELKPSKIAEKELLLRRLFFDLSGLPPTLEQMDAFLEDQHEDSYEKFVDNLLSSSSYGERMASVWMDVARYADTNGYQDDTERFNWPWRDWVIHAFNKNLPYDEFVTWQLAGDLIPNASKEQILATGFNRNHMITQEGGVIEEEYRVEYVADRTATAAKAFLGLTMECARCHDHKYDEITQKDFFNLFNFFNKLDEKGIIGYTEIASPKINVDHQALKNDLPFLNLPDSIRNVEVMVMKEVEDIRKTYLLNRGSYDAPTDLETSGSMPAVVLEFDAGLEKNRLGLSQWLFNKKNPLTARVAVNRLWQQFFGSGIVATSSDFGNQGTLPSHPELLDWLAVTFMEEDWDVKHLIKKIVMSSTYRQSSKSSKSQLTLDPKNSYLSVFPRQKLTAEMVRDNVLVSSELFVNKIGGPSVRPYQPAGLWKELTGGSTSNALKRYVVSKGGNQHRRSLYTFWKRTVPPPGMITFDAASRDLCAVERQKTSTPLQSLILLNDPQVYEAADALSSLILSRGLKSDKENIINIYRRVTGRTPDNNEVEELIEFYEYVQKNEMEQFKTKSRVEVKHRAYTSLTLLIYNLDETTQKS